MKSSIEIADILDEKLNRPFHSEADFQHSLAWRLHREYCKGINRQIRLEVPIQNKYIDIVIKENKKIVPIELKYKTAALQTNEFCLKNHGSHDTSRYDYIKDIRRIEQIVMEQEGYGYAIFLTNDKLYWQEPRQNTTQDEQFRLHEGRILKGQLKWRKDTKASTMTKKRMQPIKLENEYELNWKDYNYKNFCVAKRNCRFRYLAIKIP